MYFYIIKKINKTLFIVDKILSYCYFFNDIFISLFIDDDTSN